MADNCAALFQIKRTVSDNFASARGELEFTATTSLCVRPLRHAADFSGHGFGRQGRRNSTCHVRGESAGLRGLQLQAAERRGAQARLFMAHDVPTSGTWTDRYLQPLLLRG